MAKKGGKDGGKGKDGKTYHRDRPAALIHQNALILEFCFFARGDPHLTAWEEQFLASISFLAFEGERFLSPKQKVVIHRIATKLGYETRQPVRPTDDSEDQYEQELHDYFSGPPRSPPEVDEFSQAAFMPLDKII